MVIGISSNYFHDLLVGHLVNERQSIDNCTGVLARERRADFYQLGDERMHFSRLRLSAGQVRRGNEVVRKQKMRLLILARFGARFAGRGASGSCSGERVKE
jgi:hypothetical protein